MKNCVNLVLVALRLKPELIVGTARSLVPKLCWDTEKNKIKLLNPEPCCLFITLVTAYFLVEDKKYRVWYKIIFGNFTPTSFLGKIAAHFMSLLMNVFLL